MLTTHSFMSLWNPTTNKSLLNSLMSCLDDIKCWMAQNFLQLNENKCEIILFGPPDTVTTLTNTLGNLSTLVKPYVKNLGVIFDPQFKFDRQVNSVVKACFFQLRTIVDMLLGRMLEK